MSYNVDSGSVALILSLRDQINLPFPGLLLYVRSSYDEFISNPIDVGNSSFVAIPDWDFTVNSNLLKTFKVLYEDTIYFVTQQITTIGIFCLKSDGIIRCIFCGVEIERSAIDHFINYNPFINHIRASRNCDYFTRHMDMENSVFKIPKILNDASKTALWFYNYINYEGIIGINNINENLIALASVNARLLTFNACKVQLNQRPLKLSEAGFFYQGDGYTDTVVCFCCHRMLNHWDLNDDPWMEHAFYSPACTFVLLTKGVRFIKDSMMKIAVAKNVSLSGSISVGAYNRFFLEPDNFHISRSNVYNDAEIIEKRDFYPDSMLCKICLKEKLEVVFLHCHHLISCIQCAITQKTCGMCRKQVHILLRVFLHSELKDLVKDNKTGELSLAPHETDDSTLCKICCQKEMSVVFLPCRHVYSCYECATKMTHCPKCQMNNFALLQIYL